MAVQQRFLTPAFIAAVEKKFTCSANLSGQMWAHETPNGGIHGSGTKRSRKAVAWELQLRIGQHRLYVMVLVAEYMKGSIIHCHFEPSTTKLDPAMCYRATARVAEMVTALLTEHGAMIVGYIPEEL